MSLLWLNRLLLILLFTTKAFSNEKAFSQSYISNGDFEIIGECPKFWSQKSSDFNLDNWYSPSKATPDVFAKCSENCNHIKNWMDESVPFSSENYVGLIIQQQSKNYSEYIQTELNLNLESGRYYRVKMDLYWPKKSDGRPVSIEVLLSASKIYSKKEKFIDAAHAIKTKFDFDSLQKGEWRTVEFEFKASGQEKYLTIGKFNHEEALRMSSSGNYNYCYYFVDNVDLFPSDYYASSNSSIMPNSISSFEYLDDVTEIHVPSNCTCWNCQILNGKVDKDVSTLEALSDFHLRKGLRVDLNKVIFDYQNGEMIATSNSELNRLLFVLEEQPEAELRFIIYTYDRNENGKEIAKESALTIYRYLKDKGLSNSFSYIHAVKESLSQKDGVPRDRNIEMFVVNNN